MPSASDQSSNRLITEAVKRVLGESSLAALITFIESPQGVVGPKLLVDETGARVSTLGHPELDEAAARHAQAFLQSRAEAQTFRVEDFAAELAECRGARLLYERIEPEPRLVICGAGHVGASLARLARFLSFRTTVVDDRADFVTRERFPDNAIELIAAENWTTSVRKIIGKGRSVSVAVVTRGHNEDEECLRAVLSARPDYVGMIGSRRRTNIVLGRLREYGVDENLLQQVRAPIGFDIGAVSPEEVALAILAEIVAERRGGTGQPLSAWRRKQIR